MNDDFIEKAKQHSYELGKLTRKALRNSGGDLDRAIDILEKSHDMSRAIGLLDNYRDLLKNNIPLNEAKGTPEGDEQAALERKVLPGIETAIAVLNGWEDKAK